jgi:hypothetical protein
MTIGLVKGGPVKGEAPLTWRGLTIPCVNALDEGSYSWRQYQKRVGTVVIDVTNRTADSGWRATIEVGRGDTVYHTSSNDGVYSVRARTSPKRALAEALRLVNFDRRIAARTVAWCDRFLALLG